MKLLAIDGNSILNRAFYGIKLLSTKQGEFTNAIYGFLTILNKLLSETSPNAVAVAFDLPAPTFRHKAYDGYKAKRKGMPDELAQQMPVLKELLTAMGYKIVTCEGYEADDILGTLAKSCEDNGDTCVIATGDRDSLQLVSDSTVVRLATTKFGQPQVTLYDKEKIMEDYGVTPLQLIDIKSIQGDTSDNIPGVAGIGEKGAGELIRNYGSLEYIYDHIDELDIKPGMKTKLTASKDNAFLSYDLGKINVQAPIDKDISSYVKTDGDISAAVSIMTRLELFSIIEKFGFNNMQSDTINDGTDTSAFNLIKTDSESKLYKQLRTTGSAYFYTDYNSDGSVSQIAFNFKDEDVTCITPSKMFLKDFFEDDSIEKYTYDCKPLHKYAISLGLDGVSGIKSDLMLSAYLLNPSASQYDILKLASIYGVPVPSFDEEILNCVSVIPSLEDILSKEIEDNNQSKLLDEIEIPLAKILADMEYIGFYVDKTGIEEYGLQLQEVIDQLTASIIEMVGYEFNINSPKQLGKALFDDLNLPHGKKTKSGWSTNAEVLESLRFLHPVVESILQYRTLAKLKSTYCDGLVKVIGDDGRIHSNFNQTETRTGRISSTEPNMQNIPVRTDIGKELRKFFSAENGVLVDADYSQIELRVLAHVAGDEVMAEDFRENRDIHTSTASRVFGVTTDLVTPQMRSSAKAVNFGIVYGIGAFSLSKDIGVTRKEADDYIKEYLKNYSGVDRYMKDTVEKAKELGYVETIFGRRRYLPELKSSNFNMRSFGERVARNMPIQGAAADIIKIAMIKVSERLKKEKLSARLILQVHDELIVECPENEAETVKKLLKEEMEAAVSLNVPMRADASYGKTWYEAKQ